MDDDLQTAKSVRREEPAGASPQQGAKPPTDRSMAVAVITLARYPALRDPSLPAYLQEALDQAKLAGLSDVDLATLRLVVRAVGGT